MFYDAFEAISAIGNHFPLQIKSKGVVFGCRTSAEKEKCLPNVAGVIEFLSPFLPSHGISRPIQSVVVNVSEPLALTFKRKEHYGRPVEINFVEVPHKLTIQAASALCCLKFLTKNKQAYPVITKPVCWKQCDNS